MNAQAPQVEAVIVATPMPTLGQIGLASEKAFAISHELDVAMQAATSSIHVDMDQYVSRIKAVQRTMLPELARLLGCEVIPNVRR